MKLAHAIISSITFLFLLGLIYYIHIKLFNVNVVFYASIADVAVAALFMGAILYTSKYFRIFTHFEKLQLMVIWLLVGYCLAISVPTVIDRSLSFYILEKLDHRGGGIRQDAFEELFTKEYLKEDRLVDVRLTEQLESGTIRIQNGCVKLTERGKNLVRFSAMFRRNLLPKKRLLMGYYSDDLTDPFKKSPTEVAYKCK